MSSQFPQLPQVVTDIATLLGIVGFFMTIWVVKTTNELKKKFKQKGRIPEIHSDLKNKASTISSLLAGRESWESIKGELSKEIGDCIPLIENLIEKLKDENKSKVTEMLNKVAPRKGILRKRERQEIADKAHAWRLYEDLSSLNTRVDQILKDMRWD
ncbi:hypothetical protein EQG67_07245 [Kosakonia cowanii]|uniref:hypothetical protein n=1 Tax=Kosakonia cowanii TaxID=208223 RepID=UPI000FECAFCF|nr:hypothetical protein [Kosakonia cowanii]QAR45566.1 hypothetical protein EQG67_07245 [Kosakonia cowanii]